MRRLLLLLSCLAACIEPELVTHTQVVVALYADPELALTRIEVEVRDEGGQNLVSQHAFDPIGELPMSFGVYQPERGTDWFLLVVRGFAGGSAATVEYKLIAQFVEGKTGLLSVTLATRCAGVICDPNAFESCYPEVGRCVPIARETPRAEAALDAGPTAPETVMNDAGASEPPVEEPSANALPVPPSSHGFAGLGGRRGDGTMALSQDGFEQGERLCTADGRYCVSGGLSP